MEKNSYQQNVDEEIDLRALLSLILRNKIFIGVIAFISFLMACIYSLTLKKVWEGQFQIVLNSQKSTRISTLDPALSSLIGIDKKSNDLSTEVGILESPSVLMPVYDFVNRENAKNMTRQSAFKKWKSNLDVKLQKGTTILNITYRDNNKELILPTLKKISLIYQDYSKKTKERGDELTKIYLTDQINFFREKSANSLKAAQNYAIDQNLSFFQNNPQNNSASNLIENSEYDSQDFNPLFDSIINIENIRVSAANEITKINLQIKKINELDPSDYESLQYFGSTIEALSNEGLPQQLKEIEGELVDLRTKFTENDPSIIRLLQKRKLTIDLLKSRAIKYLKIAKLEAEATMEAAMKPKGVILKYRELTREAARDERTLFALENDIRMLNLEKAKISDPWQLITQPTLIKNPVAPSRKKIGLLGLLAGGFLGILISFYKEKNSDKVFSIRHIENLTSTKLIERFSQNDNFIESKEVIFLKEFLINEEARNIAFISFDEINISYLKKLIEFLIKESKINIKINLITSQNKLADIKSADTTILFASLKYTSCSEIQSLNNRIRLLNKSLEGFILLEQ